MGDWATGDFLSSTPQGKRQVWTTFNLTQAVLDSTRPLYRWWDICTLRHGTAGPLTGACSCLISIGNGKSSTPPFSCSRSISLKYLPCIHPFICGDNGGPNGFFVRFAWRHAAGCTINAGIKARNNYSGLCLGEWQQWKAHCQVRTPAVAWAKDLKDEEVEAAPPWEPVTFPSSQKAQICSVILPGWKCTWSQLWIQWGWTVQGYITDWLNDWLLPCQCLLNASSWQWAEKEVKPPKRSCPSASSSPSIPSTHSYADSPVYSLPSP